MDGSRRRTGALTRQEAVGNGGAPIPAWRLAFVAALLAVPHSFVVAPDAAAAREAASSLVTLWTPGGEPNVGRVDAGPIPAPKRPAPSYTLRFAALLGPSAGGMFGTVTDRDGFVYVAGTTADARFPTTPNAYQRAIRGDADAFVVKLSPGGKIVFSTLVGGSKREHHVGLTVDERGRVYLVGGTHSADFPTTPGAFDTTFNGEGAWAGDVYVAQLDPAGSRLLFSTFLGGSAEETARSIQVGRRGDIVVAGTTRSRDFPATVKRFDRTVSGAEGAPGEGTSDFARYFHGGRAFVAKLTSNGVRLVFSTLLGGKAFTNGGTLALDEGGNVFLCGSTGSPDFPVSPDAFQTRYAGGETESEGDGYLVKLSSDGADLLYSTYLGGTGDDQIASVVVGGEGRVYVSGSTASPDFPARRGALASGLSGKRDGFVAVWEGAHPKLVGSAFVGGSGPDVVRAAFPLGEASVVVSGETDSPDFPFTEGLREEQANGRKRQFVSILDWRSGEVLFSTPFAGGNPTYSAMHAAETGDLAVMGVADPALLPVAPGVLRPAGSGPESLVVGRFTLRE